MNASMLESELLRTHFDVIPFGIYVVDVATLELVFINRHFRDTLGELVDNTCYRAIYANEAPCSHCHIAELVTAAGRPNGNTVVFDLYNERDERWCQLQEKAMGWPDGRVVKYSIAVDISELKETQNRLAEAHAELALRNRELAAQNRILQENMALREHVERIARHDLKAPLSALVSLPSLLLERYDLPEEAATMVRLIGQAGHSMLGMLDQSLILYKLESGTYVPNRQNLDILGLCQEVVSHLAVLPVARDRRLRVSLAGRKPVPSDGVSFYGDSQLCRPMLQNLLLNALEASPPECEVTVEVIPAADQIDIAISNQGEVPGAIRSRLFEKYVTQGKRAGTGLGAYSAALAAKAHGGVLILDASRPGATTVTVRLPLAKEPAP
jgi:signal transduction histidine kinase